ncbi:MAG: metal ABC transporter substrate-binding protein [bacterium]|nr:metal ABC transporter substrate-binding protein [bacterium]
MACGGLAEVESIIPPVADPHDFEASMADRARLDAADLIVENGLGLEQALADTLASAEADGTPIFSAAAQVTTIEFDADMFGGHGHEDEHDHDEEDDHDHDEEDDHDDHEDDHDDHDEEDDHDDHEDEHDHDEEDDHDDHDEHDHDEEDDHDDHDEHDHDEEDDHDDHDEHDHDEEDDHDDHDEHDHEEMDDHDEHDEHDHGSEDPHVWLDPVRVAQAVESLAAVLVDQHGLDAGRVSACVDAYLAELGQLHEDITDTLTTVPSASRKLVTNHDAFGYFADRYDFEVIGTVIPSLSTLAEPSPASLEALAELIEETGVPAIFSEYLSHSRDIAAALADRLDGVSVVSLYSGALGEEGSGAETYLNMMRHNARTIAEALGG